MSSHQEFEEFEEEENPCGGTSHPYHGTSWCHCPSNDRMFCHSCGFRPHQLCPQCHACSDWCCICHLDTPTDGV
jgi:hypothetical protein